jgi:hypothetical protein
MIGAIDLKHFPFFSTAWTKSAFFMRSAFVDFSSASTALLYWPSDAQKIEDLRPMFLRLMADLVQTSKRPDISSGDAECIKLTLQKLVQMSQELSSYEYLITVEKDLTDFGENSPMRDVVKFAIDKSTSILASERNRLTQTPDQCAKLPLASGKNQQALQFVNTTTSVLNSIQLRF